MDIPKISLKDYSYNLPQERIAQFPLAQRDTSKLLHYQNGQIEHRVFHSLPDLLSDQHLLVFNNTKVIPARLFFRKKTGAIIQIFLLHPLQPTAVVSQAMLVENNAVWECIIGNLKKWKNDEILEAAIEINGTPVTFMAQLMDKETQVVRFFWKAKEPVQFVDLISKMGEIPLPPYLNREVTEDDKSTYQTVYSKEKGAVAAPTAGLHFTENVLAKIKGKGVQMDEVTLHVSAGTFQPVKTENATEHKMHEEQIVIKRENLVNLLSGKKTIAVGTTSMRTLESVYWYGTQLLNNIDYPQKEEAEKYIFQIDQFAPYQDYAVHPTRAEAMEAVLKVMDLLKRDTLLGETSLYIFPTYKFRVCDGLVTNFHQPNSTLILLVATFIGEDWRKVYQSALDNDYRFLSYGDSSLLMGNNQ